MTTICPGCFKEWRDDAFCNGCRKRLFDGKKVPRVLPFSRPAYDDVKLKVTPGRLSISGIQTKISLALKDGRLEMVESGGRYILKPIPRGNYKRLEVMPINEHLTTQIARQVFKIDVAENALVNFEDGEPAYLVRRFDVRADGSKRLQEDLAQVAERSAETHGPNYKYDFSYEEIGELIRAHVAAYPVDLERYFTLVAFNYLVHNGDAHVKNFSLVMSDDGKEHRLSPAYDLLNTRLHLPDETRAALQLFKGDFTTRSYEVNAFYAYDDFVEFARRLGLVRTRYERVLKGFVDKKDAVFSLIDGSALPDDCKRLYKEHVEDSGKALGYSYAAREKTQEEEGAGTPGKSAEEVD
jgi:serine/threonine-protein kinase HipA